MAACPSCGFANLPTVRFCGGCGKPLQDPVARERRLLTVMFCDLVGSTALAESLDPEDLADLVVAYQKAATDAVEAFDGNVAQHLGDGLLIYFGYPVAHEDDARRAVFGGLEILEAMKRLNETLDNQTQLSVRIGIHTGPVVTGEIGSGATRERLALGSTPNIAARLQGIADPNTIVVSAETRGLLKQSCELEALPPLKLKGISKATRLYRVIARASRPGFSPSTEMVGREREFEKLQQALDMSRDGQGTFVLVTADAGIGKSRLLHALRERVLKLEGACWSVDCSPYEQTSALRPVRALLERVFGFQDGEAAEDRFSKVVGALDRLGLDTTKAVPLLAHLLGLPLEAPFTQPEVTPQKRKALTFDAVESVIVGEARRSPFVWLLEDLHWADASTLEFLTFLMSRTASARVLLAMTARPTFASPWTDEVQTVFLAPLDRRDANAIIDRATGGMALPADLVEQILEKTDGIPLFVEELTRTILESGSLIKTESGFVATDLASVSVPTSLQASLTERLDRQGPAKEVAQLGAVIGREFSFEMLEAVAPWSNEVLRAGLDRLVASELVHGAGGPPHRRYAFKHALIRDAAYGMLLKSARRDYHGRIGTALLERFGNVVEAQPELAAHHFTEAGILDAAIPHWLKAGQKAAGQSANAEAISHLQRALALIQTLPDSPERDEMELGVHLTLGPPLTLAKGFVVDEVEQTYLRAQELNERVGNPSSQFWIGFAIIQFRVIRGELADGQQSGMRLLALAESLDDPFFLARAHCILGITSCYAGAFAAAASWLDRARAGLPGPDVAFLEATGLDLATLIHAYTAWTAWHLGSPEQAREHRRLALSSAEATGRAHARGHSLVMSGAVVGHFLEDTEAVRESSREAVTLSRTHGFPVWELQGGLYAAWVDAATGGSSEKSRAAETALALLRAYQATGSRLSITYYMAVVAETLWQCGEAEQAESLIDEALAIGAELPDPMWEAEVNRMKGELLLRKGGKAEVIATARRYFEKARETASLQGSRALEDRATSSLERLAEKADGTAATP